MKRKLFLLGILAAGFFAFMPAKTNAGCCEYFERTAGVFCLDGTSQQYCDDIEEETNKNKAMMENIMQKKNAQCRANGKISACVQMARIALNFKYPFPALLR